MRNHLPIIDHVPSGIHSSGHVIACHIFRPAGQGRKKAETLDGATYVDIIEKEYFGLQFTDPYNVAHWLDPTKLVKKQVKSKSKYF